VHYGPKSSPLFHSTFGVDGAFSETPFLLGTFIHDIFKNPKFTRCLLNHLRALKSLPPLQGPYVDIDREYERSYDRLAAVLSKELSSIEDEIKREEALNVLPC